ncbi:MULTISPECIES: hypothetical protein [Cyanophyceae]|nr:hypothetical protein [Trichocoleus sp. FACHB-69]MBD1933351.1 hypothetical protein [Trichocoleus sp. FACHB-69]
MASIAGKVGREGMSDRTHQAKGDRIQQLQQQIEAWQALLEKLGANE